MDLPREIHTDHSRSAPGPSPVCQEGLFKLLGLPCLTSRGFTYIVSGILVVCILSSLLEQWHAKNEAIKEQSRNTTKWSSLEPFTYDETSKDSLLVQRKTWAVKCGYAEDYDSLTTESFNKPFDTSAESPHIRKEEKRSRDKEWKAISWGRVTEAKLPRSGRDFSMEVDQRASEGLGKHKVEEKQSDELPGTRSEYPGLLSVHGTREIKDQMDETWPKTEQAATWSKWTRGTGKGGDDDDDEFVRKAQDTLRRAEKAIKKSKELAAQRARDAADILGKEIANKKGTEKGLE